MPKVKLNDPKNAELVVLISGHMKLNGISNTTAAAKLGINKSTMGKWLSAEFVDHVQLRDLIALGKLAGVPADKLREAAIKY